MEARLRLIDLGYGAQLWTRGRAREIREHVDALLAQLRTGDVLVIDLQGVEVFDFSFANELFGRTMLQLPQAYPGRLVVMEHLTEDTRDNLVQALTSMNLLMIERVGDTLRLLGKAHPVDDATFRALVHAGRMATASSLSEQLGIGVTAVNERLTKLVNLGLVCREKGVSPAGREHYVYHVLS